MSLEKKKRICSICRLEFHGYGHNPEPILKYEDRCCEICNQLVVVPIRIFGFQHPEAAAILAKHGFVKKKRRA